MLRQEPWAGTEKYLEVLPNSTELVEGESNSMPFTDFRFPLYTVLQSTTWV